MGDPCADVPQDVPQGHNGQPASLPFREERWWPEEVGEQDPPEDPVLERPSAVSAHAQDLKTGSSPSGSGFTPCKNTFIARSL